MQLCPSLLRVKNETHSAQQFLRSILLSTKSELCLAKYSTVCVSYQVTLAAQAAIRGVPRLEGAALSLAGQTDYINKWVLFTLPTRALPFI